MSNIVYFIKYKNRINLFSKKKIDHLLNISEKVMLVTVVVLFKVTAFQNVEESKK